MIQITFLELIGFAVSIIGAFWMIIHFFYERQFKRQENTFNALMKLQSEYKSPQGLNAQLETYKTIMEKEKSFLKETLEKEQSKSFDKENKIQELKNTVSNLIYKIDNNTQLVNSLQKSHEDIKNISYGTVTPSGYNLGEVFDKNIHIAFSNSPTIRVNRGKAEKYDHITNTWKTICPPNTYEDKFS